MTVVGYLSMYGDQKYKQQQINAFGKRNVEKIFLENDQSDKLNTKILLRSLKSGDTLVLFELSSLRKSVIALVNLILDLKDKNISIEVLKKDKVFEDIEDEKFIEMFLSIGTMEKEIVVERTKKGIEHSRSEGRIGGRPRIDEETVAKMQEMYHVSKCTLREISNEFDVSLGSVYKYVKEED